MDGAMDEKGIEERARQICRDLSWYPHREMTSYNELLIKGHHLDKTLSANKRIHIYPSDLAFS